MLKAGDKLFYDHYVLVELLGTGGMGQVWRARDVTPGKESKDVALKFLPGLVALQPAELQLLQQEVAVGKELRHYHIAATYDLGRV